MKNTLKLLAVVVCLLSGGSALARGGEQGNDNDNGNGNGNGNGQGGGFGAPEPITMVAVALGAGTVGLAAWRARRKRA